MIVKFGKISGKGSSFLLLYMVETGIGSTIELCLETDSGIDTCVGTFKQGGREDVSAEGEETEEENTLESPYVRKNTAMEILPTRGA
jgi:hypothetical protein